MTPNPGLLWFFFSPSGRLSKKKYMRGVIFWALPVVLSFIQISAAETQNNRTWLIFAVACFLIVALVGTISNVMLTVKRSHDRDHSGWFTLLIFIPVVGLGAFFYLIFAPSGPPNQFGALPDQPR